MHTHIDNVAFKVHGCIILLPNVINSSGRLLHCRAEINMGVDPPVWRKWDTSVMDAKQTAAWPSERSGHRCVMTMYNI
jgi:hypothetical protein